MIKIFGADITTNIINDIAYIKDIAMVDIKKLQHVNYIAFNKIIEENIKSYIYLYDLEYASKFIFSYLLNNDIEFHTIMNELNTVYSIKVGNIQFRNFSCKVPGDIKDIKEDWNIEYNSECQIIASVIKEFKEMDLDALTISSDAFNLFKKVNRYFRETCPILDKKEDAFVRESYKGGWCFLNWEHAREDLESGIVIDKNSMYPYHMKNKLFPSEHGVYFKGEYKDNKEYPLYVQHVLFAGHIKQGHFPTIQIKRPYLNGLDTWLEYTSELEDLYLTNIDLELLKEHYEIEELYYVDGYMYKTQKGERLFGAYIDTLYELKNNSSGSKKQVYKLLLNGLSGKFAQKIEGYSKIPYLNKEGLLGFKTIKNNDSEPIYVPIASFITAYARQEIIGLAHALNEFFVYSDTDSIHLLTPIPFVPEGIKIGKELGAWKIENKFRRARYIKQKTYILDLENDLKVCASGLSASAKKAFKSTYNKYPNETFNAFDKGLCIPNSNNVYTIIKGGCRIDKIAYNVV